ncbi:26S proteasome complex subunit SEM1 26S proteasome complex subunit DSS1 [Takifugu flavidus]|nr:26S proteasome complex subunit SEM1 26S proteasome complex subunit DSS1 [Takifugu flavidus]
MRLCRSGACGSLSAAVSCAPPTHSPPPASPERRDWRRQAQCNRSLSRRSVNPPEHVKASRRPFSSNIANMSEKKQTVDLGLLEEDDEFEEFPAEDWTGLDEDEDAHVWEDNWDDDNVEDDFSNQLRAELEKHGYKMETS